MAANLRASPLIVLDHGELFGHVDREVIFDGSPIAAAPTLVRRIGRIKNGHKILTLDEAIAIDAAFDPAAVSDFSRA